MADNLGFDDDDLSFGDDDSIDFGDTPEGDIDFGDSGINVSDSIDFGNNQQDNSWQGQQGQGADLFNSDFDDNESLLGGNELGNQNSGGNAQVNSATTKKTALVAIGAGVVILLIVAIAGGAIAKNAKKNKSQQQAVQQQSIQERYSQGANVNTGDQSLNGLTGDQVSYPKSTNAVGGNTAQSQQSTGNDYWKSFGSSSGITFNSEYTDLTFTVTGIEHFVATPDSNDIVLKTVLTGSLSGLAGTYKLEVPYSKGSKLNTGVSFTVHVLFGNYKGKTVIGDIAN